MLWIFYVVVFFSINNHISLCKNFTEYFTEYANVNMSLYTQMFVNYKIIY